MFKNKKQTLITITLMFIFGQASIFADGYRNTPEGAAAIGAFGGYRAFADDANATIHNSANLVDLEQPIVQLNATFGYGHNEFHSALGKDRTENPFYAIPGLSIAAPLKDGKYAIGFSAYVPYGRSVQWGSTGFFATNGFPYEGTMTVMDFTPNVAVRLNDSLSFGIGADIYYGQVEQKTRIFGSPLLPAGSISTLTADGSALGWNASATWKMTERQRLALTYRAPVSIEYKGDNEITFGGTSLMKSPVRAEIEYPTIVGLAYGVEFTDTLRAEFDVEWLEFSVYQNLTIYDRNTGAPVAASPQNLNDTWTFGIGGEWDFAEHWTARSGYKYLQNPTPDATYGQLGPDEDQGVISFGLGYENENHMIDLGYAIGLFGGRSVTGSANNPIDGDYDYSLQVLTLSYGYKF